jgi:DNA replicative helicase MCM subunit Mcm2 (Cdc46/Mcm family)
MCAANSRSLEVAYGHLAEMQPMLAVWLTDVPRDMLQILDEVLQSVVLAEFPHYKQVCHIYVVVCRKILNCITYVLL